MKKEFQKNIEPLKQSKISLILDDYNDLFSDFDPRAYTDRALSHDFLVEAKSAAKDKALGTIELSFLIPSHIRNQGAEHIIKKRLREHFKKHYIQLQNELNKIRKKGLIFAVVGAIIGTGATFIAVSPLNQVLKSALLIILEPASWFSIWSGLDHFFFVSQAKKSELEFYKKMLDIPISFQDY